MGAPSPQEGHPVGMVGGYGVGGGHLVMGTGYGKMVGLMGWGKGETGGYIWGSIWGLPIICGEGPVG